MGEEQLLQLAQEFLFSDAGKKLVGDTIDLDSLKKQITSELKTQALELQSRANETSVTEKSTLSREERKAARQDERTQNREEREKRREKERERKWSSYCCLFHLLAVSVVVAGEPTDAVEAASIFCCFFTSL